MSVITISRGSYSRGRIIAEDVAREMGYECISDEVLLDASKTYGVAESKLVKAVHEAPSLLGMTLSTRQKYIAYIQAKLAIYFLKDNIVYHGPAGHLLIQGVSHILKVRIIANLEDRIHRKMEKEGVIEKEAKKSLLKEDKERIKWGKAIYNIDETDPNLFDLIINIGQIDIPEAVKIITNTVRNKKFQPMTYSVNLMNNIELSCRVRASLIDLDPNIKVRSDKGSVFIHTKSLGREKEKRIATIKENVLKIQDVKHVEVHITEDIFKQMSATVR